MNNDKAKKILFGTEFFNQQGIGSKLPDNPEAKMNEEALKRKDYFSKYADSPFFKPAKGGDENELKQFEQPDSQNAASQKPDEDEFQMFIDYHLWPTEWFDAVVALCREQKLTIPELLNNYCKQVNQSKSDQEAMELIREAAIVVKNGTTALIMNYCKEAGITPNQLIEQHEYLCKMNHNMLTEAIKNARNK